MQIDRSSRRMIRRSTLTVTAALAVACGSSSSNELSIYAPDNALLGPGVAISSGGGRVYAWRSGSMAEALYESADGKVRTRAYIERGSDEVRMLRDENSGDYTLVLQNKRSSPDEVYYLQYSSAGKYLGGHVVFVDDDTLKIGKVASRPAFAGQIAGQLADSTSGETGSFAVVAAKSGSGDSVILQSNVIVSDIRVVPDEVLELATAITGLENAPSAGSLTSNLNISGILPKVLKVGGLLMLGGGAIVGAPAYIAAGTVTIIAGYMSNDIADYIENNFTSDAPIAQESVNFLVDVLRDGNSEGIGGKLKKLSERAKELAGNVSETVGSLVDGIKQIPNLDSITDDLPKETADSLPENAQSDLLDDEINDIPADQGNVEGQAVWQDGTTYKLGGTVDGSGQVSISGSDADSGGSITISGTLDSADDSFDGTFSGDHSGTVSGQTEAIGKCSTSQGSGGQGTFTFAHYVGDGGGSVDFFYDAYSIPDEFTLSVGGQVAMNTGGLVSGSQTVSITVPSGQSVVFVSVSAPRSSTAWRYTVGCVGDGSQ